MTRHPIAPKHLGLRQPAPQSGSRLPQCKGFAMLLLISSFVLPLSASDYTHTAVITHSCGLRATSADYTADPSSTPGGAHSASDYTARSGHSGQLYDATTLDVKASPLTLNETSTRQLSADLLFDDETYEPLPATSITWSIQSGPLSSISSSGLATAAAVMQDTPAIVHAAHFGVTGTLTLTVLNTIPDNFGLYAGDGLPDIWQVQCFGLDNPLGCANANADGDTLNNLLEYAFGTDPTSATSGPASLLYSGSLLTQRGQPTVSIPNSTDHRAVFVRRRSYLAEQLIYQVQFSADLQGWITSPETPTVIGADADYDVVSVPYPASLIGGQKARFFRVGVDFTP